MKKMYSLLSSLALLLSLPALAAPLAEKAVEPKTKEGKEVQPKADGDKVKAGKEKEQSESPICRGGGG